MQSNQLEKLFKEYVLECNYTRGLSPETIKSYTHVFNTFIKVMPEISAPEYLTKHSLNLFYERLGTRERVVGKNIVSGKLKQSTIKTYYSKLVAFFRWMERNNYLDLGFSDAIVKPPEPKYTDEKALTDIEISKLMATICLHTMDDVLMYQRDMLILNFCIYSGLRRNELLSLKVQDVDLVSRTIKVNASTSKSKKDRYIPLHPQLLQQLDTHLKERRLRGLKCPYIVTSTRKDEQLTVHGLIHWVKRYRKLSGVRFHIHQTRHTFACSLAKSGADIATIMKALGHSTTQMTERYLRSITPEHARNYIDKLSY